MAWDQTSNKSLPEPIMILFPDACYASLGLRNLTQDKWRIYASVNKIIINAALCLISAKPLSEQFVVN